MRLTFLPQMTWLLLTSVLLSAPAPLRAQQDEAGELGAEQGEQDGRLEVTQPGEQDNAEDNGTEANAVQGLPRPIIVMPLGGGNGEPPMPADNGTTAAAAQPAAASVEASPALPVQDPPARVGRLSFLAGKVSLRPAGQEAWTEASLNRPVTGGDALWSDTDGRAELHVGTLAVRLGAQTAAFVTRLDDNTVQLGLTQGTLSIRVRELAAGQLLEVDLPNAAVTLQKVGLYRIEYAPAAQRTTVTVRSGAAEILSAGQAIEVPAGRSARFVGAEHPEHELAAAQPADPFDGWCSERDRREEHPISLRYVSRATVGYEDLDDNGSWDQSPQYGAVWIPHNTPMGWAPYHDGRWVWVSPWGWSWVDRAPWGFAPFHYGRWVSNNQGLGWAPGG